MKIKIDVTCSTLTLPGNVFLSTYANEEFDSSCSPNYYVFQTFSPYFPILNEKGRARCVLNNDNITASWNVIQSCEPSCLVREGNCDNNQVCASPIGEGVERCFCAGYTGKYCENVDPQGFFFFFFFFFFSDRK